MREQFEKLFPVPSGVKWNDKAQHYTSDFVLCGDDRNKQNDLWQGFQAGHAAGLEKGLDMAGNKAVETGWYVAAEEIRAMKKQKK